MYETLILIDAESSITDDAIHAAVLNVYPDSGGSKTVVTRKGASLQVAWPSFSIKLHRNELPHVLEESQEIAQEFAARRPELERIGQCRARVEIVGDEDPGMDRFNDYCFIVDAIEKLGTVYTFDQGSG